ncbi:MAG: molybdopterin-binding protein [Candidatus Wallbacteria bacterium]|nr:molybdopterin-binding protein [Candidatus Wallbacteria bacterium]
MAEHKPYIVSINVSPEKGTVKKAVCLAALSPGGIVNDAHAGAWHRQVSLLGQDQIDDFEKKLGRKLEPGAFGENLALGGINLDQVALFDRFLVNGAELEVTQIGKACHNDGCAIFRQVGSCIMPKKGLFCRVLKGGKIASGDRVEHLPYHFRIAVFTLSDRASSGIYEDRSGPEIRKTLEEYFRDRRDRVEYDCRVLPDDREQLRTELVRVRDDGYDLVFTTGGTGIGTRDWTPDVVSGLADKIIPGIMEHIRLKYGHDCPQCLLSRSVAAVMGMTMVFALPGSVRAVREYLLEILPLLAHMRLMIHGIDDH